MIRSGLNSYLKKIGKVVIFLLYFKISVHIFQEASPTLFNIFINDMEYIEGGLEFFTGNTV